MKKSTYIAITVLGVVLIASIFIIPTKEDNTGGMTFTKQHTTVYHKKHVSHTPSQNTSTDLALGGQTQQDRVTKPAYKAILSPKSGLPTKSTHAKVGYEVKKQQSKKYVYHNAVGGSAVYGVSTGKQYAQTGGGVSRGRMMANNNSISLPQTINGDRSRASNNQPFNNENAAIANAAEMSVITRIAEDPVNPGVPVGDAVLPILLFASLFIAIKKIKGIF